MTSKLFSAAVLTAAALTGVAASADTFNSYLWDQMKAPSTRTRAEVKVEVLQVNQTVTPTPSAAVNNLAAEQPKPGATTKVVAPQNAAPQVKASQP